MNNEERMRNRVPTRDDLVVPTLTDHNRRKAEYDARIQAHERAKARDLWVRMHPGRVVPEELQEPANREEK